jgi:hypothetical protein
MEANPIILAIEWAIITVKKEYIPLNKNATPAEIIANENTIKSPITVFPERVFRYLLKPIVKLIDNNPNIMKFII